MQTSGVFSKLIFPCMGVTVFALIKQSAITTETLKRISLALSETRSSVI